MRSQLQTHVEILENLAAVGPLNLRQLTRKLKFKTDIVKELLVFLAEQGFVKQETSEVSQIAYAVTAKGINVLRYFGISMQIKKRSRT